MPYTKLDFSRIEDKELRELFDRANAYLADVYSLLHVRPRKGSNGGEGNLTSVLLLCCVIDALSIYVYPKRPYATVACNECGYPSPGKDNAEQRFKRLVMDKMYWDKHSGWLDKEHAALLLYLEIRNPLAHALGKDVQSRVRYPDSAEPVAGRWGRITTKRMDRIDARKFWNPKWPIMEFKPKSETREKHVKISAVALYWAVKQMCVTLIQENTVPHRAPAHQVGA